MITFAMFGAGRIGKIHASNVASADGAKLAYIVDVDQAAMDNIAKITGAKPATREQVFADKTIDAVVICSPTDTHAGSPRGRRRRA